MTELIFAIFGTMLTITWFVLAAKGIRRYAAYVNVLDGQEYFVKELFGIGYYAIELFQMELNGAHFRKRLERLTELRGKNNASFYVRADLAAQITYAVTLLPFGLLLAVMTGEYAILLLAVILSVILAVYVEYDEDNRLEKRHQSIKREFPHVLSQMSLLINAGMPLREAIESVASRGDSLFYEEIRTLLEDMKNGIPEYEALQQFALRCGIPEVRKFSSIVIQNVKKGSTELAYALLELSQEVWRERVNGVRADGENASAKLLIPIFIIFGGILLMVVVPVLKNMNF